MNAITLTEFAQQHRLDLLAEAAEYREARRSRRSRRGGRGSKVRGSRRHDPASRSDGPRTVAGHRPEAATR